MQSKYLWELQEVDRYLQKISKEIKQRDLVLSLKEIQIQIDELQGILDKENFEIGKLEKTSKKLEQEIRNLENKKIEQEKKLYSGSCNVPKELEGMKEKVDELKVKIDETEELLLIHLDKLEDKVQIINQSSGQLEELDKEYRKGVKKYKQTQKALNEAIVEKEAQKLELKKRINKELLSKYAAMQKRYNNSAIAKVEDGLCSGCRIEIPIMQLKTLKEGDTIKCCEHCGRILTILD